MARRFNAPAKGTVTPQKYARRLRQQRAFALLIAGWSRSDIAKELRISPSAVSDLINEGFAEAVDHRTVRQAHGLAVSRLEAMLKPLWSRIQKGDDLAVTEQGRRIIMDIAQLCGLTRPENIQNILMVHGDGQADGGELRIKFVSTDGRVTDEPIAPAWAPPSLIGIAAAHDAIHRTGPTRPEPPHQRPLDEVGRIEPSPPPPQPDVSNVTDMLVDKRSAPQLAASRYPDERVTRERKKLPYPYRKVDDPFMTGNQELLGSCDRPEPRKKSAR